MIIIKPFLFKDELDVLEIQLEELYDVVDYFVIVEGELSFQGRLREGYPFYQNNAIRYEKYKDKGFTVLSVAADEDKDKWLGAIRKDGIGRWTHVSDLKGTNNEVAKLYFVKGYPSNFLIDPNGIIIAQNLRGENLGKKLSEIFR